MDTDRILAVFMSLVALLFGIVAVTAPGIVFDFLVLNYRYYLPARGNSNCRGCTLHREWNTKDDPVRVRFDQHCDRSSCHHLTLCCHHCHRVFDCSVAGDQWSADYRVCSLNSLGKASYLLRICRSNQFSDRNFSVCQPGCRNCPSDYDAGHLLHCIRGPVFSCEPLILEGITLFFKPIPGAF